MASKVKPVPPSDGKVTADIENVISGNKNNQWDDDDNFQYEEIAMDQDDDEDLLDAFSSLQMQAVNGGSPGKSSNPLSGPNTSSITHVRPSVVDDFVRNFLIKAGMKRSLETFNTEWYELQSKGRLPGELSTPVPDIYLRNEELDQQARQLREQVEKMREIANKAQTTWDKFRKERDFHRMHHQRVIQEKNKLVDDIRRMRNHMRSYEPAMEELKRRHETAIKEKMLVRLERDRLKARVKGLEEQVTAFTTAGEGSPVGGGDNNNNAGGSTKKRSATRTVRKYAVFPPYDSLAATAAAASASSADGGGGATGGAGAAGSPSNSTAINPYLNLEFDPAGFELFSTKKTFKGHVNAVSSVAFHPKKSLFASASDDETWRLWSFPDCELIMSGEGHTSWLSSLHFHPHGSHLATASGDATIKLWEFASAKCNTTFTEHTQAVWTVEFHHAGDFLVSASMDHTARIWDVIAGKCKTTLRGHVDSVNCASWQPYSANVCTASGDKTVSVWDGRTGLCVQTLYGHSNSVNHLCVSHRGDMVISADADGVLKVWDIRMVAELGTVDAGQYPINSLAIDRSGSRVIAASDDGACKIVDLNTVGGGNGGVMRVVQEWSGHEAAVQSIAIAPNDAFAVTGSSDCTFKIWGR